jgi:mannan endo-1,4-beta-mannosidase
MFGESANEALGTRRCRVGLAIGLAAGLLLSSADASAGNGLVCGVDSGDHGDHIFGNHRFGPQHPHHFPGGHHRHFGHHGPPHPHQANDFVRRVGSQLKVGNKEFRFAGTNNYYSAYKSQLMVDDVLNDADEQGFSVLRTWAFIDIGNQDDSNSTRGKADGVVYYHYKDGAEPAFNDGPDGLQHLDYVVFKAGQLGLKLVLPLTNNWGDFGGMDQYVAWAGGQFHDQFYTDPKIRRWYKEWVAHVLNHKNFYTGVRYKDDPAIMTWELTNEARCGGGNDLYPRSDHCTSTTLTQWANEMSTFVKSVDRKHLVSVGDEGFYCIPGAPNFIDNCSEGVDTLAFTQLPNIDVMSFHLYPDGWGQTVAWGQDFIERHFADALALHKPAMLGEFGLVDTTLRNPNYKLWTDTTFDVGGAGALFWMLAGVQDDGTLYPDFDGFTVYCPGPVCSAYSHFSAEMSADRALSFPPVADDDLAETTAGVPVTLAALANDVTYGTATLVPTSIDLDPSTPGQQITATTAQGSFDAGLDGSITFTPAAGFVGDVEGSYTVSDNQGRSSEEVALSVTVKPAPEPANALYSFESGTQGWAPASFNPSAGTVEQSADFHSDGSFGLKITSATGGGWFGVEYATAIDLSGTAHITWQVKTTDSGTSQELALQTGDSFAFCTAGGFQFVSANTTASIDIDLSTLDCGGAVPDLSHVHNFYIFAANGGGTGPVYLDQIRAVKASDLPPPGQLYGFESGTQGWAAASFNAAGSVGQSSDFASDGSSSLKVSPTGGGWFGVEYSTPLDLSGKTHVSWDLKTTDFGTSQELALQTGSDFAFCSAGGFQFINANSSAHIDIDLSTLDCSGATPNLAVVHNFYIFMGNGGDAPLYIDNVIAQ